MSHSDLVPSDGYMTRFSEGFEDSSSFIMTRKRFGVFPLQHAHGGKLALAYGDGVQVELLLPCSKRLFIGVGRFVVAPKTR
jgi:hypothetical protein